MESRVGLLGATLTCARQGIEEHQSLFVCETNYGYVVGGTGQARLLTDHAQAERCVADLCTNVHVETFLSRPVPQAKFGQNISLTIAAMLSST